VSSRNKSNKLSERQTEESGNCQAIQSVSLGDIISHAIRINKLIKSLEKTVQNFNNIYDAEADIEDDRALIEESDDDIERLAGINETVGKLKRTLYLLVYIRDSFSLAIKNKKKFLTSTQRVIGKLKTLGDIVFGLTEDTGGASENADRQKPADIEYILNIYSNLDKAEQSCFYRALESTKSKIPPKILAGFLDYPGLSDEIKQTKAYQLFKTKPQDFPSVYLKTQKMVHQIAFKLKQKTRKVIKAQATVKEKLKQVDVPSSLSKEEAEAIAFLAGLEEQSRKKNNLPEALDAGAGLTKELLEKHKSSLGDKRYKILLALLNNRDAEELYKNVSPTDKSASDQAKDKEKSQDIEIKSLENIEALDGSILSPDEMEQILDYLNNSDDRGNFLLNFKGNTPEIALFIPSRSKTMARDKKLIAIYPKIAGAVQPHPLAYVSLMDGDVLKVNKGFVTLKKEPETKEGPKQYPGSEIDLIEEGDEELLSGFFNYIKKVFPPPPEQANEALSYRYIQRRTDKGFPLKAFKEEVEDYFIDLPRAQRVRLKKILTDQGPEISKYVVALYNNRGKPAPESETEEEETEQPEEKKPNLNEPYRKILPEIEKFQEAINQGKVAFHSKYIIKKITRNDEAEQIMFEFKDTKIDIKLNGLEVEEKIQDGILYILDNNEYQTRKRAEEFFDKINQGVRSEDPNDKYYYKGKEIDGIVYVNKWNKDQRYSIRIEKEYQPEMDDVDFLTRKDNEIAKKGESPDASPQQDRKKAIEKIEEINKDIKNNIPWVWKDAGVTFDIDRIQWLDNQSSVSLYYVTETGKGGRRIGYPDFLKNIEDGKITKKEKTDQPPEQEPPTPEETQQDADDAAEAARKAEEAAKTEADKKAAEEAAIKAAEAKRKKEEAEELEKQRKAEEAEKARLESEAAAKAAKEEAAKVIPLKQPTEKTSGKFKLRQKVKDTEGYEALKSSWDNLNPGKSNDFELDLQAFVDFFGLYGYHRKETNESVKDIEKIADINGYIQTNKDKLIGAYRGANLDAKKKAQIDRIMGAILKGKDKNPELVKIKLEDIIYNIVKNPEKTKKQEPKDTQQKAAENIERLLSPLVREVVRKKWQKRIT